VADATQQGLRDVRNGQPGRGGQQNGRNNPNGPRRGGDGNFNPQNLRDLFNGGGGGQDGNEVTARGPLTGDDFRDWADRLRDVEEMVDNPELRAQAAQIRERARAVRNDVNRHSEKPNWDIVRDTIGQPLVELRNQVSQELLRRQSDEALVPIDREPVPPQYAEQVRKYYERLGSGKQ
jgi:hypothetical protein